METALRKVQQRIETLRLSAWLSVVSTERCLSLLCDQEAIAEVSKLDGCCCSKTDLDTETASNELVHERFNSLADIRNNISIGHPKHLFS